MKIKIKENGQEVKFGDFIYELYETSGYHFIGKKIMITKDNLSDFVEKGILVVENDNVLTLDKVTEHIANRIGWKKENVEKYLDNLYYINKTAVFSTLLKEIAIMLDKKYEGHISKCKEIWILNKATGSPQVITDASKIKNIKNFAAFRTRQDIDLALNVLSKAIEDLYGEQKN